MSSPSFPQSDDVFYLYLILGVLSGVMVGISLAVSTYFVGDTIGTRVVRVGLGVSVGLAVAGSVSFREIRAIESITDSYSEGVDIDSRIVEIGSSNPQFVAGIAPVIGLGVTLYPFVFQNAIVSKLIATAVAVTLGIVFLFVFGAWLGSVTRQRWYIVGLRIAVFGPLVAWANGILI